MRALTLDYRRTDRTWHWAGLALLLLMLAGAVQMVAYYRALTDEIAHLDKLAARIEHKLHPVRVPTPITSAQAQQLATEVNNANEVVLQLNLPWDQLFQTVESANGDDVALLGIVPDVKRGRIKVSGEVKEFGVLLDYLRTLQESEFLTGVYLEHHQVQEQDPEKPIRFALDASWTAKH